MKSDFFRSEFFNAEFFRSLPRRVLPLRVPFRCSVAAVCGAVALAAVAMVAGCGDSAAQNRIITNVKDLSGKSAAYLTGSAFALLTTPLVDNVEYLGFNDNVMSVQALRSGKVDAVLLDEPVARLFAANFADELYVACVYSPNDYAFVFSKGSPLAEKASEVIRELKRSGEMSAMISKWCGPDAAAKTLPALTHRKDFTGRNGRLRYAAEPVMEPMCYLGSDGAYIGLEMELMRRVAYELDMKFEFCPMSFGGLIDAVAAGKVDAAGGAITITEERKQKISFSECHYIGGLTILARRPSEEAAGYRASQDLNRCGLAIGVPQGAAAMTAGERYFNNAEIKYFDSLPGGYIAVQSGKIDAFVFDRHAMEYAVRMNPDLALMPDDIAAEHIVIGLPKSHTELLKEVNAFIAQYRADGTYQDMYKRWFLAEHEDGAAPMPDIPAPKSPTRKLTVGTEGLSEPMNYYGAGGELTGFDIEFCKRLALYLNAELDVVAMTFYGLIPAVSSGKIDMLIANLNAKPESAEQMLMSDDYVDSAICLMVRKDRLANCGGDSASATGGGERGTFAAIGGWLAETCDSLEKSFERTFLRENRWQLILSGLKITVIITVMAAIFGTLLSFVVCAMRRSANGLISGIAKCYIAVMQGTPILVMLMILYYVVFVNIDIDAVWVAVIGFSLNFAAYVGEMFRSGFDSIPKGQTEAALALGFTRYGAVAKVILPQVVRIIIPVYRGEFISMLKMSSIVGYIAIQDLTKMSDIIRSRTYEAFFPLVATAVIYFVVAQILAAALTALGNRLDPRKRRLK